MLRFDGVGGTFKSYAYAFSMVCVLYGDFYRPFYTLSKLQWPRCNWEFQCRCTGHSVKFNRFTVNFHWFSVEFHWNSSRIPLNFPVAPGSLLNSDLSLVLAKSVHFSLFGLWTFGVVKGHHAKATQGGNLCLSVCLVGIHTHVLLQFQASTIFFLSFTDGRKK